MDSAAWPLRLIRGFCFALSLASAGAAWADQPMTVQARADRHGVSVLSVGLLDQKAVDRILHHAASSGTAVRLVLSGPGGHHAPMMRLIRFLQHRPDIEVVAAGECLSACAIVWATAPTRLLRPDAFLGFHGGTCRSGCAPGRLNEHDRRIFALIERSAPLLAASLSVATPHAFARRGGDFVTYPASLLHTMGIGRMVRG